MINHTAIMLALRARALTLSVCTTGPAAIAATATGYSRAVGSFLTDGFAVGMELTGTAFSGPTNNGAHVVTDVTATDITCPNTLAESAGAGVLTVGFPALRVYENQQFTPVTGRPYAEFDYLPGPVSQVTVGTLGELEALPMSVIKLYAPSNTGSAALYATADAVLALFAPRTALTLPNGDVLRVREGPAPYRGQLLNTDAGFAVVVVTIPCWIRTANII